MNKCNDLGLEILAAEFIETCRKGNLLQLEISLNSDFTKHPNFKNEISHGFGLACSNGHLEVIKILTALPLDEAFKQNGFAFACLSGKKDVIEYFLYDLKIELERDFLTVGIKVVVDPFKRKEIFDMIEKRNLLFKLNKNLNKNDKLNIKVKI